MVTKKQRTQPLPLHYRTQRCFAIRNISSAVRRRRVVVLSAFEKHFAPLVSFSVPFILFLLQKSEIF